MKLLFIKQYIAFLDKTLVGKILRFLGRVILGRLTFLTGINLQGKEFLKITTSYFVDNIWKKLSEQGFSNLNETEDFDSAKTHYNELRKTRRRS